MKEDYLQEIERSLKYFDDRKSRAEYRMADFRYNEEGWFFGLYGFVASFDFIDLSIGRIQKVIEPPGEVELASVLEQSGNFSVIGRYARGITYELFLRDNSSYRDRIFDVAWWVISALRIRGDVDFLVPVAFNHSWSVIAASPKNSVKSHLIEDVPRAKKLSSECNTISYEDVRWVDDNFINFAHLLADIRFRTAVDSLTTHHLQQNSRMAIALIWSGIEAIFGIQSELRFRLAAQIASLLVEKGIPRYELHQNIKKLYDVRSKAVHGSEITEEKINEHLVEVRKLLSNILAHFIEAKRIPSVNDFEQQLFT